MKARFSISGLGVKPHASEINARCGDFVPGSKAGRFEDQNSVCGITGLGVQAASNRAPRRSKLVAWTSGPSKIKTRYVDFGSGCQASCFNDEGSVLDFGPGCHAAAHGSKVKARHVDFGSHSLWLLRGFFSRDSLGLGTQGILMRFIAVGDSGTLRSSLSRGSPPRHYQNKMPRTLRELAVSKCCDDSFSKVSGCFPTVVFLYPRL